MGHRHTLGPAGRARGVDQIGGIERGRAGLGRRQIARLFGVQGPALPIERDHRRRDRWQPVEEPFLGEQGRCRRIRQHERQALRGIGGIERHIGRTRLEGPEHRHGQVERALEADADPATGPGAVPAQEARHLARPAVERAVGELLAREDDGDRRGGARRPRRDDLVEQPPARIGVRAVVPLPEDLVPLGRGEERQLGEAALRRGDRGGEQRLESPRKTRHGRGVEQVRVVLPEADQPAGALLQGDHEVEPRHVRPGIERLQGEPGEAQGLGRRILQHEHHLEERCVGEAALRLQLLDQLLERQLLVGVGAESRLPHLRDEPGEPRIASELAAQGQGVDEEPDQPFRLHTIAAGDRRADHHVVLPGNPRQQRLQGGERRHEEGGAGRPAQSGEIAGQCGGEPDRQAGAAEGLDGRSRPVERQLDHRRRSHQALPPPGELLR